MDKRRYIGNIIDLSSNSRKIHNKQLHEHRDYMVYLKSDYVHNHQRVFHYFENRFTST